MKLFQNLTSGFWEQDFLALYRHEFLHVCIVQKAPIHQSHIYRQIKILRTIFEKGHPRNIPVKLFKNLMSGFGEKSFLRISSCPYCAKSPHSAEPYYRQIKILRTIFKKGHPRNIPVKLFQNLTSSFGEEDFLRIFSCPYSARSPHSPEPCIWRDQNFANTFWKGSPKDTFLWNYFKIWPQQFWRRRFFKNFFMFL